MRAVVLVAVAGCSFTHGSLPGTGSGDAGLLLDGQADSSEGTVCTTHRVPTSVSVDATVWAANFLTAPVWNCNTSGKTTINSTTGVISSPTCALGTIDVTNNVAQLNGGPMVLVVRLRGLTVSNGHVLGLIGDKPIVLLVAGDVVVDTGGMIDASASMDIPGPGGSMAGLCTTRTTGLGTAASSPNWGGGGGAFGGAGGHGCYDIENGGLATGDPSLVPLRGGCSGGHGNGGAAASGQVTGAGGGAMEISASGTITIGATGVANVVASGGGAPAFTGGGNGGGAGGGILLNASVPATFGTSGAARAHGGSGSQGSSGGPNDAGRDGHTTDNVAATDTSGTAGGGNNLDQGRVGGLAHKVGSANVVITAGSMTTKQTGGRGGGGGGGGRIVITTRAPTSSCD